MSRIFIILVIAVLTVIAGLLVRGFVRNPMDSRQVWLEQELAKTPSEWTPESERAVDFARLQNAIGAKPKLWQALIPPPVRQVAAPDLERMLRGVVVVPGQQIGSGANARVLIKLPDNPRGEWKGIGDEVKGLRIKEIARNGVVLSLAQNGREYTTTLPR